MQFFQNLNLKFINMIKEYKVTMDVLKYEAQIKRKKNKNYK